MLLLFSVDYPEEIPDTVRGKLENMYFNFKEVDGQTRLKFHVTANPSGKIPAWVYNKVLNN